MVETICHLMILLFLLKSVIISSFISLCAFSGMFLFRSERNKRNKRKRNYITTHHQGCALDSVGNLFFQLLVKHLEHLVFFETKKKIIQKKKTKRPRSTTLKETFFLFGKQKSSKKICPNLMRIIYQFLGKNGKISLMLSKIPLQTNNKHGKIQFKFLLLLFAILFFVVYDCCCVWSM